MPETPYVPQQLTVTINGVVHNIGKPIPERQFMFLNATAKEQMFGGAKRGAKTVAGSIKALFYSFYFPGNKGYILRQDLTDLKESTLETFLRFCPPEMILEHNRTDRRLLIRTPGEPSKIIYSGLADEKEEESSKGKEAGWIWIDEPSEIKLPTYLMYLSQLCWSLPPCRCPQMDRRTRMCPVHPRNNGGFPPFEAWLTTNPEAGWVEDRFRDLIEEAGERRPMVESSDRKRVFIRSLPRDNPYLPPGWESELRTGSTPQIWIDKYLNGQWGAVQGQVFKEWDKGTHGIPSLKDIPPDYLKTLKLVGCLDHGTTGVTCYRIDGIDADSNIITLASHYAEDRTVHDHATAIKSLLDVVARICGKPVDGYSGRNYGQYPALDFFEYSLIDPSTQAKTQMVQNELWSIQDLYWREGIPTMAAHNAIQAGVDLLLQYVHIKPTHCHPFKMQQSPDGHWNPVRGAPSWYVVLDGSVCPCGCGGNRMGVRELVGWKIKLTDRGEKQYVGPDHWIDCGRYIAMSRPTPPQFTPKDMLVMDTHSRQAQRALQRFDKTFASPANPAQWFPGGTSGGNVWFEQPN